jgi:hypothetical protein
MSDSHALPLDHERRIIVGGDRRLLHRGDDGRRGDDAAPTHNSLPPASVAAGRTLDRPGMYLVVLGVAFVVLWGAIIAANQRLNPLVYDPTAQAEVAEALVAGQSYGVFDLNIDMRGLRREHIKRLPAAPEIAVIGASHWQEGVSSLFPDHDFYNAHVHRDYYEDILAVVEMFVASDRLPETLIISIRELTFSPPAERTDFLWLAGLEDYRAMARRLGIEPHGWLDTFSITPWLDLTSLPAAWDGARRRLLADERPGPTTRVTAQSLDILHPAGFITWSEDHEALFTQARAVDEAQKEFDFSKGRRITIDAAAVDAIDRLLGFLVERGVHVILVHPPFNPVYHDQLVQTPYGDDMQRVVDVTAGLAARHGLSVIGSFDATAIGCDRDMFIDSQHGRPECLGKLISRMPLRKSQD